MTAMLRLFASLLLLLAALPAQHPVPAGSSAPQQATDPGKLEAVKNFRIYFKKFKQEAQQVEAVMTLKGNECPEAAEELRKLTTFPNAGVQAAALKVIATYNEPATFQTWIAQLPTIKDVNEKATTIRLLGQAKIKTAVPAIKQAAAEPKAPAPVKVEVARALHSIGDPDVAATIEALLADPEGMVRLAAADAAGALKLTALGPKVVPLLKDEAWQVQSSAIAALGILRPQVAVQPLIDLMRKAGRMRIECAEALFKITGMEFGVDPERWQTQWDALMKIPGWRIPTEEELQKKAAERAKYDKLYGKVEKAGSFVHIPTTSTNVLFIIDVSGSMDDLVVEREKFQGYDDFKKFTVVKKELLSAIETLADNVNFDIVAFATEVTPWQKRLVPANIINKEAARSFINRLKPIGGTEDQNAASVGLGGGGLELGKTNTLGALMYAFGIDPNNPPKGPVTQTDKAALKNKLDTVYFLSDGRPSIGRLVDTKEILAEVTRFNEFYKIVIHAIAIGEFQKEFMRDLAAQNGGVFMDMGR
jgi:HEAT repeats/von Willebrand factor type A domain